MSLRLHSLARRLLLQGVAFFTVCSLQFAERTIGAWAGGTHEFHGRDLGGTLCRGLKFEGLFIDLLASAARMSGFKALPHSLPLRQQSSFSSQFTGETPPDDASRPSPAAGSNDMLRLTILLLARAFTVRSLQKYKLSSPVLCTLRAVTRGKEKSPS